MQPATTHDAPIKPDRIMQFAWGYAPPVIIDAAVRIHLFDAMDGGPKLVSEIATATGASPRALTAILNALVGLELLQRDGERYKLAPDSAAFLVSTKPAFHGTLFRHMCQQLIPKWLTLPEVIRTGKPAMMADQHEAGSAFFSEFVESIFPLSYAGASAVAAHLQLSQAKSPVSVLDLAAGSGVWGIALAQQSPRVSIRAVDWAEVLPITKKVATRFGLADRLTLAPGDLTEADFGTGHQVATLGHILHSEGRERSRKLLRRTFDALAPGGTIVIAEFVPNDDRTGPPAPLIFAVNMLINTQHGETFTFAEISAWLKEAGFINPRQFDAPAVSPLILANRP
jgi:ubiquinone/menaquinone biosynthesis C-methylase UbiE